MQQDTSATPAIDKTCSCGKHFDRVPAVHKFDRYEMYYWECQCRSTMTFTPNKERTMQLIREEPLTSQLRS